MKLSGNKSMLLLALSILLGSAVVMVYMLFQLRDTEQDVAEDLISKPVETTQIKLNKFFDPISNALLSARDQGRSGLFSSMDEEQLNKFFIPVISHYHQVSSMGIAHSAGYEIDILRDQESWLNRVVDYSVSKDTQRWSQVEYAEGSCRIDTIKFDLIPHDPRDRPWFKGASMDEVHWTEPYIYNTTGEPGITASIAWIDTASIKHVLAYDLTLKDLTTFTSNLDVSQRGMAFILSNTEKFIGLPNKEVSGKSNDTSGVLGSVDQFGVQAISDAIENKSGNDGAFSYTSEGETWWASLKTFKLSDGNVLTLGVVIPEEDVTAVLRRTRYTVIGGFSIVFFLSLLVFRSLRQMHKANIALGDKNREITSQRDIIEEKNKDIIDSISYAKRIQTAILPSDRQNSELLGKSSFVFFRPKDIVSGDFYWINRKDGKTCFTVSDCTGHGVPGAFMSMIGASLYNQVVMEKGIVKPSEILYEVRRGIISALQQQGKQGEQKDGMDASFCVLHEDGLTLEFAGAHNPIYLIRENADKISVSNDGNQETITASKSKGKLHLFDIKGDKQPIGFYTGEQHPFTNIQIQLKQGDLLYLFSDGFPDQFGGERGKKYKYSNFKRYLLSTTELSMQEQYNKIADEFERWKGEYEQLDDVCIIGLKV